MKLKLKTTLLFMLLVFAILPSILIGATGTVGIISSNNRATEEKVQSLGYMEGLKCELYFSELLGNLSTLSLNSDVLLAVDNQYSAVADKITNLTNAVKSRGNGIMDVVVMNTTGNIIADSIETTKQGERFFGFADFEGLKKDYYVSNIYTASSVYDADIFYIATQIKQSDEFIGNLAIVVNLDVLVTALNGSPFLTDGKIIVMDRKGTLLNYNQVPVQRIENVESSSLKQKVLEILKTPPTFTTEKFLPLALGDVIGGYNQISKTNGWYWFGYMPASAANGLTYDMLSVSTIILGASALIYAIVAFFVVRSILTPMKSMILNMELVKKDKRNQRLSLDKMPWEFGRMSLIFNQMLGKTLLSEELHRSITQLSDNILFEWNFEKAKMFVSDNFEAKFKVDACNATLLNGHFIDSCMDETTAKKYHEDMNQMLKTRSNLATEYQVKTTAGNLIWISVKVQCMVDRINNLYGVIGVITDIDVEKKLSIQLSERASYDFLSQLYNRSTFERQLQAELSRSVNAKVGILFLDIDDFKKVNDVYGHAVGDEVIKFVSGTISKKIEGHGFAGRFGGDEFVMCVTSPKAIREIDLIALEIIDDLKAGYYSESAKQTMKIKTSIGVAFSPEHGVFSRKLIGAADEAMYFVKKNGKSNFHIYNPHDFGEDEVKTEHK